jgi:hypothetical protein
LGFALNVQEKFEAAIAVFDEIVKESKSDLSVELYFEMAKSYMSGSKGDILSLKKAEKYLEVNWLCLCCVFVCLLFCFSFVF